MTQPLVYVDAPATTPYRFGLFAAAAVVDPADQREFQAGVEWEPQCVDAPAPTSATAASDPERAPMALPDGVPSVKSAVIRLYVGLTGRSAARPDLLDRARRAMGQVEQQSLEHYVWTGEAGNVEFLAAADAEVLAGSDAAPVPLEEGVGRLEAHIADRAGVLGVLWAPRWTAGWFAGEGAARPDEGRAGRHGGRRRDGAGPRLREGRGGAAAVDDADLQEGRPGPGAGPGAAGRC